MVCGTFVALARATEGIHAGQEPRLCVRWEEGPALVGFVVYNGIGAGRFVGSPRVDEFTDNVGIFVPWWFGLGFAVGRVVVCCVHVGGLCTSGRNVAGAVDNLFLSLVHLSRAGQLFHLLGGTFAVDKFFDGIGRGSTGFGERRKVLQEKGYEWVVQEANGDGAGFGAWLGGQGPAGRALGFLAGTGAEPLEGVLFEDLFLGFQACPGLGVHDAIAEGAVLVAFGAVGLFSPRHPLVEFLGREATGLCGHMGKAASFHRGMDALGQGGIERPAVGLVGFVHAASIAGA
jgi:hypothetical protein